MIIQSTKFIDKHRLTIGILLFLWFAFCFLTLYFTKSDDRIGIICVRVFNVVLSALSFLLFAATCAKYPIKRQIEGEGVAIKAGTLLTFAMKNADLLRILPGDTLHIFYTLEGKKKEERVTISEEMWNDIQDGKPITVEINKED